MTEEQAIRLIEAALRRQQEMARVVSALILASPIEEFVPEIARADFLAWVEEQQRP